MLAALTTKRYNTSTQMHKNIKKEKKHSQYTSQQQFMCRRKKISRSQHTKNLNVSKRFERF